MIKVFMVGRLGADATIGYTKEKTAMLKFALASSENIGNAQSGDNWKTTWMDILVWGRKAEDLHTQNQLKKGAKVFVEGKLDCNEWTDKSGQKRKSYSIIGNTILVAAKKDAYDPSEPAASHSAVSPMTEVLTDEDIPF